MSALEKFTNFLMNNPVSKEIGRAVQTAAEWISTPAHVRAMLKSSRILQSAEDGDVDALKKALNKESKIDYKNDPFIKQLVSRAAEYGRKDVVQMLLDKGASPVSTDWQGFEPAEVALKGGHLSVVELLYNHANDKGPLPTDKLKNAFSVAQDTRAKQLENNSDTAKPAPPTPAGP